MSKELAKTATATLDKWTNPQALVAQWKKQHFPKNATENDIAFCTQVALDYRLDPNLKHIHFIARKAKDEKGVWSEKIEPMIGRGGYRAIALRNDPQYSVQTHSEVQQVPTLENGQWVMKNDLVAICKVYKSGCTQPFVVRAIFKEFVQKTKDGKTTSFWEKMPNAMLEKVAESQALRAAFNVSGILGVEESGVGYERKDGSVVIDTETLEASIDVEAENTMLATQEQAALAQFGLSSEYKQGWIKVVGNTHPYTEQLKALGYQYYGSKKIWAKQLVA